MEKIPAKIRVSAEEYETITKKYEQNPCKCCSLSFEKKAACGGCRSYKNWDDQFEGMPYELRELAIMYSETYDIDKEISGLKLKLENLKKKKESILEQFNATVIRE